MKKMLIVASMATALVVGTSGTTQAGGPDASCWGAASAEFAGDGFMGPHSSEQATPRVGLRNLARALADAGIIADDSMASLGQFVATELGYDLEACDTGE